jgi:hypothetical protein
MMLRHCSATFAACVVAAGLLTIPLARPVAAQTLTTSQPIVAPSGRAITAVCRDNTCRVTDPRTLDLYVEYGTPSVRGRKVEGGLIPLDSVWRLGANPATHLFTKADLTLGGTKLPAGSYTLALVYSKSGSTLIINKNTGQWGIPYDSTTELARIPVRVRKLKDHVETLAIALVPATGSGATTAASGVLTIAWGTLEFSADWRLGAFPPR